MLELKDLHYGYTSGAVLSAVTAHLSRGQLVCAAGRNGAGKTTLLRLAAGLLPPDQGEVLVSGQPPYKVPRRLLARRLSYLPQTYELAFPFRASEIVLMGRTVHARSRLGLESTADVEAARLAMARLDVEALADRRFSELSGGEQRRVLLAQALCQQAELLLLDEPTAALDPSHALSFMEALRQACHDDQLAALVVTHDLNLAARFADQVWLLAERTIIAAGGPLEVLSAETLERAFALPMHVGSTPNGSTYVVPS